MNVKENIGVFNSGEGGYGGLFISLLRSLLLPRVIRIVPLRMAIHSFSPPHVVLDTIYSFDTRYPVRSSYATLANVTVLGKDRTQHSHPGRM